jgi:putative MATE family efflux protein
LNLTQDPVQLLIRRIALPASIGMFFSTMYYMVDNFYAGMLSSTALAGIALAGPVFFMGQAISIGIGQGTNALVGNARGAEDHVLARQLAGHALSFSWLISLTVGLLILLFAPHLFNLMGADSNYSSETLAYLSIMLPTLAISSYGMAANGILNAQGDTKSMRNSLMVAFFANILLDPLFIFVFDWGIMGLAAATAVTQLGSALYLTIKVRRSELGACLDMRNLSPDWQHYKALLKQSIPASGNLFLIAIGSLVITSAVTQFGESAVAGHGIAMRIEQLVLLPTIGLNIAVMSLVSTNYGAKQYQRMDHITYEAIKLGVTVMLIGGAIVFVFAPFLVGLFTDNQDVINVGVSYLRVEALILPAYVLTFVSGATLQAVKKPLIPVYFNVVRTVLLPATFISLALTLIHTGIYGIWWSIAIATWFIATIQFMHMRKLIKAVNVEKSQ